MAVNVAEPHFAQESAPREPAQPYTEGAAEVADHLCRLHVILRRAVLRFRAGLGRVADGLDGIAILDSEIDGFLGNPSPIFESPETEWQPAFETVLATERHRCDLRSQAGSAGGIELPIDLLRRRFDLSDLELDLLLICAAAELHQGYGRLYAYLHNDITQKRPTVALLLDIFGDNWARRLEVRHCLMAHATLRRQGLLFCPDRNGDGLASQVIVEPSILQSLLGAPSVAAVVSAEQDQVDIDDLVVSETERDELRRLAAFVSAADSASAEPTAIVLRGPAGVGKRTAASALCRRLARQLFVFEINRAEDVDVRLRDWMRDVRSAGGITAIRLPAAMAEVDKIFETVGACLMQAGVSIAFILAEQNTPSAVPLPDKLHAISVDFGSPRAGLRRVAWARFIRELGLECCEEEIKAISSVYPFAVGTIRRAARDVRDRCRFEAEQSKHIDFGVLAAACRARTRHRLGQLSQLLPARCGWNDIVLPADELCRLQEIANAVRSREQVMERWAFAEKLSSVPGVNALFFGPSGTGKTMAASILGKELGMGVYRVDLSRVVSKYIGETERNLDILFEEARRAFAILFFDEAEALFGKRSEVKDAHDRYANIEVAYLLQRMESFEGVAILATNLRKNMDNAFLRRLQFAVEFPLPSLEQRLRIWRQVWPPAAEMRADIDLDFMAATFEISGGHIRNIALMAAYLAAQDGTAIAMPHLIGATRREFQKLGQLCVPERFGKYHHLVAARKRL
jgi:AAA+ superfamily predicted ATPase